MLNTSTGNFEIDGITLGPGKRVSELLPSFVRKGYREGSHNTVAPLTSVRLSNNDVLLILTFKNEELQHIVLESQSPQLNDWSDISESTEIERARRNDILLGHKASEIGEQSWGIVTAGRDPRDVLSRVWIDYNR